MKLDDGIDHENHLKNQRENLYKQKNLEHATSTQELLFNRKVTPQNLFDLQSKLPDYPLNLLLEELELAQDNVMLALATIAKSICEAIKNNHDKAKAIGGEKAIDGKKYVFILNCN